MHLQPYSLDELNFAYRCYIYFRWHTYRCGHISTLNQLRPSHLETIHPEIHVLELTCSDKDIALLASIQPQESVSAAASKLKGASSKIIRELSGETEAKKTLAAGYFAATTGANNSDQLNHYLGRQATHHGYDRGDQSPVWVQTWNLSTSDLESLQTRHAQVSLRWHIVLSTCNRVGIFTLKAAQALCNQWTEAANEWRVRFQKVSVVPDHLHAAVWTHPSVAPANVIVAMMNSSQDLMRDFFPQSLIIGGQPRLWNPGAYVGSFGDLTKAHVRNYLRKWERSERDAAGGQSA